MKFLCPNCKAKYQISDEKIAGRTLKMDCRRCNHPIVIRGDAGSAPSARPSASASRPSAASGAGARRRGGSQSGPAPARSSSRNALGADFRKNAGAAPAPARSTALDQWHVAINDVPVGPMKRDEIAQKITSSAVTGDSLCWREGFGDWRPLKDVPELAALLRRPAPAPAFPPPARGLGHRGPPAAAKPARPPAGRAPAPVAPRPAAESRPAARGNVVPIGGRLGGAAAPALDDFSDDELLDDEPTRVGSMVDFAEAEQEQARQRAEAAAREAEQGKARQAEQKARREADKAEAEAAEAKKKAEAEEKEKAAAVGASAEIAEDDAFDPFASQRAPSPLAATPAPAFEAPPAEPTSTPAPTASVAVVEQRRRGIPVGAWIAIAGAMAFGVTLAVMIGIRLFREPPPQVAASEPQADTRPAPEPRQAELDPAPAEPDPAEADPEAEADPSEAAGDPGRPRRRARPTRTPAEAVASTAAPTRAAPTRAVPTRAVPTRAVPIPAAPTPTVPRTTAVGRSAPRPIRRPPPASRASRTTARRLRRSP